MAKLCSFEKYFEPFNRVGASVLLRVGQTPNVVMIWIYFSFITTLTANLMSFIEANKPGAKYSHLCEISLDTVIFLSILNQITLTKINGKRLTLLSKRLLEPFKKYPKHTRQFKIICRYRKRVAVCAMAMLFFVAVGVIFHILNPLAVLLWGSNQDNMEALPLPLGKVPLKVDSTWLYVAFYVISTSCLLVSSLLYVCWFFIMVCSTFQMMTELKILSMEVRALNVRAEELCEHRLSFCSRQKRLKIPRDEIVNIYSLECLKEVVKGHITIMRHVRLLETSYRWVILGYSKAAIFITALALMIIVDEWKVKGSFSTVRINMTISTLFFIFINSYSGQIIINESENLRVALCGINWMDKSTNFKSSLKIMMTVTQKPLCLTAGTLYILGMESYSKTMEAVYSFINFLIPLRR